MDIRIQDFDPFKEVYGFVAGDHVLRFMAMLLGEVLEEFGTINDFIGHAGNENYVLITTEQAAPFIRKRLKERFDEEIQSHYSFMDREQGAIILKEADGRQTRVPLMRVCTGDVSPSQHDFADIREITEMAAEMRRQSG